MPDGFGVRADALLALLPRELSAADATAAVQTAMAEKLKELKP